MAWMRWPWQDTHQSTQDVPVAQMLVPIEVIPLTWRLTVPRLFSVMTLPLKPAGEPPPNGPEMPIPRLSWIELSMSAPPLPTAIRHCRLVVFRWVKGQASDVKVLDYH